MTMEISGLILSMLIMQLVAGLVFANLTTWIAHKHDVPWRRSVLAFVVPWLVWLLVDTFVPRDVLDGFIVPDASLSNAVVETLLVGCIAGVIAPVYAFQKRLSSRILVLAAPCAISVALWAFFPALPE